MIRLFATDMDGTFLRDDMSYDRALFAKLFAQIKANGQYFVVASGNQYAQIQSFFPDDPAIIFVAENGAYIRRRNEVLRVSSFAEATVANILPVLDAMPEVHYLLSGEHSAYVLDSEDGGFVANSRHYYHALQVVPSFSNLQDRLLKVALSCLLAATDAVMARLRTALGNDAVPTSSGHGDIDIIQPGVHKAAGLAFLGRKLNIPMAEMCAFGDGGNDLEMLREVGLGVAMANAQAPVTAVADAITSSKNEQGVLQFMAAHLED